MPRSESDPHNLWLYKASLPATIIIASIYLLITLLHIFQAVHYKARFCIPLIMGALWETTGYAIRAASTRNESSLGLYATQLSLIVLAPAFVAAFNYMLFGRILRTYSPAGESKALKVSDTWVTRILVAFDVLSFLTQGAGAALFADPKNGTKKSKLGEHIVIAGLILQLVAFGFFTAAAVRFHIKIRRWQKIPGSAAQVKAGEWKVLLYCLYASCVLIMLRSAYRIVEFSQGFDGYLASHEVYFYVLEAVPMMPPFILFNICHPGRVVNGGFKKNSVIELEEPVVELSDKSTKTSGDADRAAFSTERL